MALTKISTAMWNSVPHHDTHDFNVDDVLYVDVSANSVGIGTTSPSATLHTNVTGNNTVFRFTRDTGTNGRLDLDFDGANSNFNSLYGYTFQTDGTERMRIHSGGDISFRDTSANEAFYWDASAASLGVGSGITTSKLAVSGSMPSAGTPLIKFNETSGGARDGIYLNYSGPTNSAVYLLKIADTLKTHLAVRGDGNVGIGTTSPSANLEVASDNALGSFATIRLNAPYYQYWDIKNDSGLSFIRGTSEYLRIDSSGNVGIETGNLTIGTAGKHIEFYHPQRTDANDGKIGAGIFGTGLNIVGVQTAAGTGRLVRIWGDVYLEGGSIYSSIFYDSSNTSYYVNPDSTSKSAHLRGLVEIINETPKLVLNDFDATTTTNQTGWVSFQINGTESGWVGYGSSGTSHLYVYNTNGIIYNYGSYTLHENSSRAPIFYDSNNTGYYLDPNSTSNLNTVSHNGLSMTNGTAIDQLKTYTVSLQLATSWIDTGINGSDLSSGVYIFSLFASDSAVGGGHYSETYAGIISWYGDNTNSTVTDEIIISSRSGHAPNAGDIQLRIKRTSSADPDDLVLQIKANYTASGSSNYTFKFRRMI